MSTNYINNIWQNGGGREFNSTNPANQEVLWTGNYSNKQDVDLSITVAKESFKTWSQLDYQFRSEYIKKYIEILSSKSEELSLVIHQENGKPLWEARTEVQAMVAKYNLSEQSYNNRTGSIDNKSSNINGISSRLTHRPIGVMVVFGPFNFPGHLPNGHIIPALLAGNTVVFKPSEQTPFTAELMVKYWEEAGLPKGVLNLVHGSRETGEYLVQNSEINGVLFTGSYNVGRAIHGNLAGRPEVLLALEMGGNNPLIVDVEINNLDAAVYNIIQSSFITAGQRCTCSRRLYIPSFRNKNKNFSEKLLDKLINITSKLAVSDGINKINMTNSKSEHDYFMGPVISLESANNIVNFKNDLLNNNSTEELLKLKQVDNNSALLTPGIILNTQQNYNNLDYDTECFGPLLQIFYYENLDDAIEKANNTRYGLSAGLLSDSEDNFNNFYNKVRAGIVNWNRPTTGAAGSLPFGGIGYSGNYKPSAAYAADYCAYPMATQYSNSLIIPDNLSPGIYL